MFFQAFEDLEFHQMEEAAHKETERDELLKEITELEKQVDAHEKQLTEIDKQQKELLKNVRKETEHLEQLRKNLTSTLNKVSNFEKINFFYRNLFCMYCQALSEPEIFEILHH